jgi:hypothetical protein
MFRFMWKVVARVSSSLPIIECPFPLLDGKSVVYHPMMMFYVGASFHHGFNLMSFDFIHEPSMIQKPSNLNTVIPTPASMFS